VVEVDEGDWEAATFCTCGVVILSAVVTGSREPALIANLTRLPIDFVRLTLELCGQLHLWWSPCFEELARTVREQGDDAKEVSDALQSVIEEFSMSFVSDTIDQMLHRSREHLQFGGGRDPWPTVPDGEEVEVLLRGSSW
jgi:hypothetical protein